MFVSKQALGFRLSYEGVQQYIYRLDEGMTEVKPKFMNDVFEDALIENL